MNWRPDDWNCPYKPDGFKEELYTDLGARDASIFEAGADAMLEVLRPLLESYLITLDLIITLSSDEGGWIKIKNKLEKVLEA